MAIELEKLARKMMDAVQSAGTVRLWGVNLSRPGDFVYRVASATVSGGHTLRLELALGPEEKSAAIEIDSPTGAKVAGGNLTIQGAAAIRLDGKEKKQTPEGAGAPALFVGD